MLYVDIFLTTSPTLKLMTLEKMEDYLVRVGLGEEGTKREIV